MSSHYRYTSNMLSIIDIIDELEQEVPDALDRDPNRQGGRPQPPKWIPLDTTTGAIDRTGFEIVFPSGSLRVPMDQGDLEGIDLQLDENEIFREESRQTKLDVGGSRGTALGPVIFVGIEALAWYAPFHFYDEDWGIYIPESSLWKLSKTCFSAIPKIRDRLNFSREMLSLHEQFHFIVECMASQWELLLRSPCVRPERKNRKAPYNHLEEKLANAYVLRGIATRAHGSAKKPIRNYCAEQPAGYRDGPQAEKDPDFCQALTELTKEYIGPAAAAQGRNIVDSLIDLPSMYPTAYPRKDDPGLFGQCPSYLIRDGEAIGIPPNSSPFYTCISSIDESLPHFQRSLRKQAREVQQKWEEVKLKVTRRIPSYPEFEKERSRKGHYSLRVTKGSKGKPIRAILKPPEGTNNTWVAVEIGNVHKKGGHG